MIIGNTKQYHYRELLGANACGRLERTYKGQYKVGAIEDDYWNTSPDGLYLEYLWEHVFIKDDTPTYISRLFIQEAFIWKARNCCTVNWTKMGQIGFGQYF